MQVPSYEKETANRTERSTIEPNKLINQPTSGDGILRTMDWNFAAQAMHSHRVAYLFY
jgi:hypothetical protein